MKEYELYQDENDGYRYILTVVDHFSNYPWAFPLYTKQAEETAFLLYDQVFSVFGPPKYLQSDNGGEFVNHVMDDLAQKWNVQLVRGKAYNPREQGKVEHFNGTFATYLAKQMHEHNTRYVLSVNLF
ncbi:transposase family protein [Patescibacteria group bacterium]|nr:transposase family protein [Patescibacteria group bacterium]